MAKGKGKGSQFERDLCKRLSLWWTNDNRDDIFWRSQASGGRATSRSKKGRETYGQYGDIQAVDPKGKPLIDLCTIEAKIGYKGTCMMDIVDIPMRRPNRHPQFEKFLEQVTGDARKAKTKYWLLISRNHTKEIMVWMPARFFRHMKEVRCDDENYFGFEPKIVIYTPASDKSHYWRIVGTTLDQFLGNVRPKDIRKLFSMGI